MIRRTKIFIAGALAAAALAGAQPSFAQVASTGVEPDADAALDRMGAYLRTLTQFEVISDATIDVVLADNQKLQTGMRTTYLVERPHHMRTDILTDRRQRRIFFDGKELTVTLPESKKYVTAPVEGTIGDVLGFASERLGLDFPLQDLFRWGDPSETAVQPVSGFKVGDVRLNGELVEHFAYRQPEGVDFQIWLAKDNPLPRKIVITDAAAPAQPQMTAVFTWNLKPKMSKKDFVFDPAGWEKVEIGAVAEN